MRTSLDSITPPQRPQQSVAIPAHQKNNTKNQNPSAPRPIEINISLPKLPRIRIAKLGILLRRIPRRIYAFLAIIVIIAVLAATVLFILDRQRKTDFTTSTAGGTTITQLDKGQPDYATILPEGKSITELGGWTRVSPPERNPVFAYVDVIEGTPATISEQPLPDAFKEDLENQILYLAQGYHADVKIDANGTTVYIGTSAKGPQSVIFTKNNLLVLIKASAKVSDDAWATYISSLK